jgi:hypothetical protein
LFLVIQYDYSSIVDSVSISVYKYRRLRLYVLSMLILVYGDNP